MKKSIVFLVALFILCFPISLPVIAEEAWMCPACGSSVSGNFCNNCGAARPSEEWTCPSCSLIVKGNYCNNCGTARPTQNAKQDILPSTVNALVPVSDVEPGNKGNPIDLFRYKLEGNKAILKSYLGKTKRLVIDSSYVIDGKTYITDLSDFHVGIGNSIVTTLVLNEGITEVDNAIFNSTAVDTVYFPTSMKCVYDNTLAYIRPKDGKKAKIYYGGTKDQWVNIFTEYHRKSILDSEFGEEMGAAAADAINQWIGHSYESSEFEYYFSATPDMVE